MRNSWRNWERAQICNLGGCEFESHAVSFDFNKNERLCKGMNASSFFKKNSSTILTCIGGVGVVATWVMAVKATPKALKLIEKSKEEKGEDLTTFEMVKIAGPVYIPSIITGAATIACIFGANILNKRVQASIISAYALADNSYKEYKKKVEELYGEGADRRVTQEIAKDKYDETDILVDGEKELFYDNFSMRYFESTMENVIRAEYDLNRALSVDNYACVNEFYDFLGIEKIEGGSSLGWSEAELFENTWCSWLDFRHEKVVMDDGLECYIVYMSEEPSLRYLDY